MSSPRGRRDDAFARGRAVYSISSLPVSRAADRSHRVHAYLLAMGIRTACFVLGGVFFMLDAYWVCWVCFVAAALLPYPAVIVANNVNRRTQSMESGTPVPLALGVEPYADPSFRAPDVVIGEPLRGPKTERP